MNGQPDLGRKAFNTAEMVMRSRGFKVLNPACLPVDLPPESYMPICLAMLGQADAIVLLPGWDTSPGSCLEHEVALYQHLDIIEYIP